MVKRRFVPSTTEYLKEIGMYLAFKEMLQNKLRYSLILTTIFLIAFMVFFMTSLALGLVRNNRVLLIIGKQQELCYPIMQMII